MLFKNSLIKVISENNANRHISLLIACLVFILSLTILGTLSIHHYLNRFQNDFDSHLLFEITLPSAVMTDHQPMLTTLQQQVNSHDGVLGSHFHDIVEHSTYNLPIIYLEVSVKERYPVDPLLMLQSLQRIYPKITFHTFDFLKATVSLLNRSLMIFTYLIIFFVSVAIIVTMSMITRSGLRVHKKIIDVMRLIGAPNGYIAKQFQWIAFRLGFVSSLIGIGTSVVVFLLCTYILSRLNVSLPLMINVDHIFLFSCLTPFIVAAMSLFVARIEMMHLLTKLEL
jgi:cell division transport system permease protein